MNALSVDEYQVLERVDEYSLYCFYLGYDPLLGASYSSPLRPGDNIPSFGVFVRKFGGSRANEYLWKDNAMKAPNYGDIFDLLAHLFEGIGNRFEAMWKVLSDFGYISEISASKRILTVKEPRQVGIIRIRIISRIFNFRDLSYWEQYGVTLGILEQYNTHAVKAYWLHKAQYQPIFPRQCYAYEILGCYQLYQPFAEKREKFRNNWSELCVPGLKQAQSGPLHIITKAMKDVMCLRSLGFDATAPKAENVNPHPMYIDWCKRRYKRTVTLFDNDGKTSEHKYPFEHKMVPVTTEAKDISDYHCLYGKTKTLELLNYLLYGTD